MYVLSQDEKDRICAEVEYRQAVARELESPKKGWAKFSAVCAHPILITVLGGLLIAGAGTLFQHFSAVHQQELQRQRQILDKKFAVLSSFTEQFEKDMTLLVNLKLMELTKAKAASDPSAKEEWQNIRVRYEKIAEEHWKKHRELGVIVDVKTLFTNPEVHNAADRLEKKVRSLLNDRLSAQQIEQLDKGTEEGMLELAQKMGKEINQHR